MSKYLPDDKNICLKCKHSKTFGRVHWDGEPSARTFCVCRRAWGVPGGDKGARKTCKSYEPGKEGGG